MKEHKRAVVELLLSCCGGGGSGERMICCWRGEEKDDGGGGVVVEVYLCPGQGGRRDGITFSFSTNRGETLRREK